MPLTVPSVQRPGNIGWRWLWHRSITRAEVSVSMSAGSIDCGTEFCEAFAEDPGNYTIASVGATAITTGLGLRLQPS